MPLPEVRKGLQLHLLDDELLVYDKEDDTVHLLNETTACALKLLQEGRRTASEIDAELAMKAGAVPGDGLLTLAIDELRKARLLEESDDAPKPLDDLTRRDVLRKMALTGAAALLIPAITTLSARRAYGQTSDGLCREKKECCTVDADCCSNKCDSSTGTGCQTGPLECH